MTAKQELIKGVALALTSYGYTVYLSKGKDYGFYTDGKRVVTFGGHWSYSVDFSGCYISPLPMQHGTGWQIAKDQGVPTEEEAMQYIQSYAPQWAVGTSLVKMTTPERHLKTYGWSSGYEEFKS